MSRSALWRQEGNLKERERQAEDLFRLAVEEGRNNRQKNVLPLWGPDDSFHFNPMLLQNIIKSSYFQKCCRDITDWNTLVDEVFYQVKHLQPWAAGSNREPSTAFCLLLRLLTLRCTEKQMKLLLDHPDSPYIRAIGFLYLRYAGDPKTIWQWIEPYLYDEEPIQIQASVAKQKETVGDFVRLLYTNRNYCGTILPRLPIQMEREIQVKLLQAEKIEERAQKHASNRQTMESFKKLGSKCMALYGDEENPIQWYDAVIDRVITTSEETQQRLRNPKFVVTFPEYGNTETVSLGKMEMPGSNTDEPPRRGGFSDRGSDRRGYGSDKRKDDQGYHNSDRRKGYADSDRGYNNYSRDDRGYSNRRDTFRDRDSDRRSYDDDRWDRGGQQYRDRDRPEYGATAVPNEDDLYEEVRRRERETVTTSSRASVSRRSQSAETSLVTSSSHGRPQRAPSPPPRKRSQSRDDARPPTQSGAAPAPRKRTAEELAAIQGKKRKLMAKYG